ncbi:MAG: transposase [Chitinophagaceae bacterium]|nr:transposase [Chitinophagaceae bacterium]
MEQHNQQVRPVRQYSEMFKRQVIEEYLSGSATQAALQRKYDIRGKCAILSWRRTLGMMRETNEDGCTLGVLNASVVTKMKQVKSTTELQQRIKELERQLEDAQLRAEAYSRIIDKAEKELKIPIRKKPNTR